MDLNLDMFKAYDIRTPARQLPPALSERLIDAIACYFRDVLHTDKVVLSRDARLTGAAYLEQGLRIFRDRGFTVYVNPQVSSTCHFYYTCMRHSDAAGIMFGASHNPGKDTGLKIVGPRLQPIAMQAGPKGGLDEIRSLYKSGQTLSVGGAGSVRFVNYLDDYIAYAMQMAGVGEGDLQGLRILADFLHGAAGEEFVRAFALAGVDMDAVHAIPDGHFPAGPPNPVVESSIRSSLDRLACGGYDLAMFFDGDGDRLDLYSGDGVQVNPCFNFSILAPALEAAVAGGENFSVKDSANIFACIKANPLALLDIAQEGFGVTMIRNGHSQIKEALRTGFAEGYFAAVEESGHYYCNMPLAGEWYATENTLFFALLSARFWKSSPDQYADKLKKQREIQRVREWGYCFPGEAARSNALEWVEKELAGEGVSIIRKMPDGTDLEATLIRSGIPSVMLPGSGLDERWFQVAQRVSQSEKNLARWEVCASHEAERDACVATIEKAAAMFGGGEKYIG